MSSRQRSSSIGFPFLFGGTFIEGAQAYLVPPDEFIKISLPFRRDFH